MKWSCFFARSIRFPRRELGQEFRRNRAGILYTLRQASHHRDSTSATTLVCSMASGWCHSQELPFLFLDTSPRLLSSSLSMFLFLSTCADAETGVPPVEAAGGLPGHSAREAPTIELRRSHTPRPSAGTSRGAFWPLDITGIKLQMGA